MKPYIIELARELHDILFRNCTEAEFFAFLQRSDVDVNWPNPDAEGKDATILMLTAKLFA